MALTGDAYDNESSDIEEKSKQQPPILTEAVLADHAEAVRISEANDNVNSDDASSQVGAGLLAGVTGLFLGGPILGTITGASAYYVASNNDGLVGEAARNSGDWAIKTGAKVTEVAKEADEQHHILDKVGIFFSGVWQKVVKFDDEHRSFVKETMSEVGAKTVEFERNHHVFENTLVSIRNGIDYLLEKLSRATGNDNSVTHATHNS